MAVKALFRWKNMKYWGKKHQTRKQKKANKYLLTFANTSKNYHELNVEFLCLKCIMMNFP